MQPLYPGQFHTVKRNLYNIVFCLDFAQSASLDVIAGTVSMMIQRGIPIRFGVVPMLDEDESGFCEFGPACANGGRRLMSQRRSWRKYSWLLWRHLGEEGRATY